VSYFAAKSPINGRQKYLIQNKGLFFFLGYQSSLPRLSMIDPYRLHFPSRLFDWHKLVELRLTAAHVTVDGPPESANITRPNSFEFFRPHINIPALCSVIHTLETATFRKLQGPQSIDNHN